jgi:hypothetical protein
MGDYIVFKNQTFPVDIEEIYAEVGMPLKLTVSVREKKDEFVKTSKTKTKKEPLNKFYCAARHISNAIGIGTNDEWTKPTLEEATKHAREMIREEDLECVAIVKVVRIVRKKEAPITVEDIK